MVNVLFTLLRSPFESNELNTMELIAKDNGRGVLLFQDAVYYATMKPLREELLSKNYSIYALQDELAARGFGAHSVDGVEVIGYDRAVDLIMEEFDKVVSL
jgi:sulfur relay protein TusB/DsrH